MHKDKDKQGYIYLIHCGGSTHYKIGITYNSPVQRMRELQIGCPHRLTMVMAFAVERPEVEEHRLHERFEDCRVNGEWFNLEPQAFADFIFTLNPMMVGYTPPSKAG